ncbi:Polyisoprenyl-teichoic acid--peptidoglycan teichoic acid transferase TagU [Streptomyces avidinii]
MVWAYCLSHQIDPPHVRPVLPCSPRRCPPVPQPHRPARPAGPPPPQRARRGAGAGTARHRDGRPRWGVRIAAGLSVAVLGSGAVGHAVMTGLDTGIERVDPFKDMKNRPQAGHGLNFLLVGTDGREKVSPEEKREYRLGGAPCHCTDTIMLVHLSADKERASVVSLPRDSYAEVPAHRDLVTGKAHKAHPVRLNAAYAEGGPNLTVRTVENMTRVKIDHYLEVDFTSFMKTVDAMGGVDDLHRQDHARPQHGPRPAAGQPPPQRRTGPAVRARSRHVRRGLRPRPDAAPAALHRRPDQAGDRGRGAAEPGEVQGGQLHAPRLGPGRRGASAAEQDAGPRAGDARLHAVLLGVRLGAHREPLIPRQGHRIHREVGRAEGGQAVRGAARGPAAGWRRRAAAPHQTRAPARSSLSAPTDAPSPTTVPSSTVRAPTEARAR